MAYINCGVLIAGERPKTKKVFKDALQNNLAEVVFDCTSLFEGKGSIEGADLQRVLEEGNSVQVTGPDPFNNRRWFARVYLKDERIVVS